HGRFARFLHLPFPRLRHWSGKCRQLARILPDAHATQLSAGLLLPKLNQGFFFIPPDVKTRNFASLHTNLWVIGQCKIENPKSKIE
ncbi:hypothetical protein ACE1AT_14165, partial [Pelatocladus sp. BLCC-F211]|uniref:hypothetical protein n=1 Tax=Pelatocladus sp. BLCC-F211 TaxID=3342752 RepID=UPI0035B9C6DC